MKPSSSSAGRSPRPAARSLLLAGAFPLLVVATLAALVAACDGRGSAVSPPTEVLQVPAYTRTRLAFADSHRPVAVTTGDFDGDGALDVAAAGPSSKDPGHDSLLRLYLLKKGRGYRVRDLPLPPDLRALAAADLDGDGAVDLISANGSSDSLSIYRGPHPTREDRTDIDLEQDAIALAVAQLGGGPRPDLAVLGSDARVAIGVGNRDRGFAWVTEPAGERALAGVVAADVDGDRNADLVFPASDGADVVVLLQRPGGFERTAPARAGGRHATGAAVADFDGDGIADVATTLFERGAVHILLGTGGGRFRLWQRLGVGPAPRHVSVTDLNMDHVPDLAVTTASPDHVVLLYGLGKRGFASIRPLVTGASPSMTAAADFNGDGMPDLVTVDAGAGSLSLFASSEKRWRAVASPHGPFAGGRSVAGPAPLYDDAVAAFKKGDYFETMRILRRVRAKLEPRFSSGGLRKGRRDEEREVYLASVLLTSDLHRYYTGDPTAARDLEASLASSAAEQGDLALAAAQYLSLADVEREDLDDPAASIQALLRLDELFASGVRAGETAQLLADLGRFRIDLLHRGYRGYTPRLPRLAVPRPRPASVAALRRTVLPHLDAYGEPSAGTALYDAFETTHPRSFRASVAAYLRVRETLGSCSASCAAGLARDFARRAPSTLLRPILQGEVLARVRALGDAGAAANVTDLLRRTARDLDLQTTIGPRG